MEARPGLCRMVGFGGGGTYGKEVVSAMHQSSGPYGGGYGGASYGGGGDSGGYAFPLPFSFPLPTVMIFRINTGLF